MALLGGAIAHIQNFERATTHWSFTAHFLGATASLVKAFFIALIIYYLHVEYRWSEPLSFVATGVLSVFASDAIYSVYGWLKPKLFGGQSGPHDRP